MEVRVVVADMDQAMQSQIVEETKRLYEELDKEAKEKDVATALRTYLDEAFGKSWHVIVGVNFGSSVSSLAQRFLYFYCGTFAVLAFQTK